MATADEQIRVSDRVKKRLDNRRRDGESYNDVLDRLLGNAEGDFDEGFGVLSDAQGEWIRTHRAEAKRTRKERMRGLKDE